MRKNSTTACRDLSILSDIDPLMSKMTPSEIGASSLEKCRISCGLPLSVSWKFSFSSPVTRRFIGSVMVTGTSTRSTSSRNGLVCVFRLGSISAVVGTPGNPFVAGASFFSSSRGLMCTSS